MSDTKIETVWVYRDRARRGFAIGVVSLNDDGCRELMLLDGSRVPYEQGYLIDQVTMHITEAQAQGMMNQLWADGLRPDGYRGGDEVVEAVREQVKHKDSHIEDLRYFARLASASSVIVHVPPVDGVEIGGGS